MKDPLDKWRKPYYPVPEIVAEYRNRQRALDGWRRLLVRTLTDYLYFKYGPV